MFFREREDGIELYVRLTPRGATDRFDGLVEAADGRQFLAARVRAVPEKGAANCALEALVAKAFGLPRKAVSLSAGHTSRVKTISIIGEPEALAATARDFASQAIGDGGKRR